MSGELGSGRERALLIARIVLREIPTMSPAPSRPPRPRTVGAGDAPADANSSPDPPRLAIRHVLSRIGRQDARGRREAPRHPGCGDMGSQAAAVRNGGAGA